jgi:hypothetical protein
MKTYVFNFRGMALGGLIVVTASSDKAAYEVALAELNSQRKITDLFGRQLVEADPDISEQRNFTPYAPTVHYVWDGDY